MDVQGIATSQDDTAQDGARVDLSDRIKEWRRLLLDTSKRNRLINSKFGRGGVLAIEHPDSLTLWKTLVEARHQTEFISTTKVLDKRKIEASQNDRAQPAAVHPVGSAPRAVVAPPDEAEAYSAEAALIADRESEARADVTQTPHPVGSAPRTVGASSDVAEAERDAAPALISDHESEAGADDMQAVREADPTNNPDKEPAPMVRRDSESLTSQEIEFLKTLDLGDRELISNLRDKPLDAKLKRLDIAAATSLQEQGVNSLFLAFGFLRWFESGDSDEPLLSPLVLVPVSLDRQSADSTWHLSVVDDDIAANHSLIELLRAEFRLTLPSFEEEELLESPEGLEMFLAKIRGAITGHDRWGVEMKAGLGIFAFQKISMWQDLLTNEQQIINNPLCRAVAGDPSLLPSAQEQDVEPADLDRDAPPETSDLVLDCDSSQLAAIQIVERGHHLIVDGPPGTGKSQTIANVIAKCLAKNQTVLFVSEKAAALDVVKRRLDEARLGDFCLECHSHKANKRAVVEQLSRCLNREPEVYALDEQKFAELRRTREKLNTYVHALHQKRSALNISAYAAHGRLARSQTSATTRLTIEKPFETTQGQLTEMEEAITRLAGCQNIIAAKGVHPWRGLRVEHYNLTLPEDVRFHFARAATGLGKRWDAARILVELKLLSASATVRELTEGFEYAAAVLTYPRIPPRWVELDLLPTAKNYLALHELASNYQILASSVANYAPDAPQQAEAQAAQDVASGYRSLIAKISALPPKLREQLPFLEKAQQQLNQLAQTVEQLHQADRRLLTSLGLSSVISDIKAADEMAAHTIALTSIGRCEPQWLDDVQRTRLRQIAAQAKDLATMIQSLRARLEPKLQPLAFTPVAREQINSALRHQSWFSRLGGAWRRAKQSFATLYSGTPPTTTRELLDDAFHLSEFHRYTAQLEQLAAADRAMLRWNGQADFNWDDVIGPLETIDRIPSEMRFSEVVKSFATDAQPQNRDAAAAAAKDVQSLAAQTSGLIRAASDASIQIPQLAPDALSAWCNALAADCDQQRQKLIGILELVEEERDVSVESLEKDVQVLVELNELTINAQEIVSKLDETLPVSESRMLGQWGSQAELATWIVQFFEQHNGSPPAGVIRILSDDPTRDAVAGAIKAAAAADDDVYRQGLALLHKLFDPQQEISTGIVIDKTACTQLTEWLNARMKDADRIPQWVTYANACAAMGRLNLSVLCDEVLKGAVPVDQTMRAFRQRFYRLWLNEAYRDEPTLRDFDASEHEQTLQRFQSADRFWVKNGFAQVRPKVLARSPRLNQLSGEAPENSEVGVLLREVHKQRRHLPLRRLFASIPTLLPKLKPCVMMSPLAVSTYLGDSPIRFDVVVFDEASQVRPHDAICAIYRGAQLIIAGDQRQLPPTNFFERLADSEEDDHAESSSADYESILDLCSTLRLPRHRLKWHYRSRRESLIAFSNQHFYDGELITFPSVRDVNGSSGVSLCMVENGQWSGGSSGGVNAAEATRIAEAVISHAQHTPEKSLGVIAMNQPQQMMILELIDHRRRESLHLEEFFSSERPDPFFVKNLENVQGDERDVVFLGVGYAKNAAGTLSHNFGPLNRQGGERRLNVAVTRAREQLVVFTSIHAHDIDLSRTSSRGAALLRAYLDFAERGKVALPQTSSEDGRHDFDSDFEAEVARALTDRGLIVHHQIGCSGFRVDLALVHPDRTGQYLLGIECDGATYHSCATARDRDRLRQDVLEGLGWKIVRIWSTDWIRDPNRQIEKVVAAYEAALAASDDPDENGEDSQEDKDDVELLEPLKQRARKSNGLPAAPQFDAIDDVPAEVIRAVLVDAVNEFGSMPADDLVPAAARKLGFHRTGPRIRQRLSEAIDQLISGGKLAAAPDGRVGIGTEENGEESIEQVTEQPDVRAEPAHSADSASKSPRNAGAAKAPKDPAAAGPRDPAPKSHR